ncbi:O-antigen ligase family protein [Mycolicibacterium obuense]|uniref:O-antigen ligase family protein n=1 Tax=Mycolicibacterium obuense TaxID=1807 RepID=UPI0009E5D3FE|nr:O-antigen ligase family protein [Mycolicibacterium obuense]
MGEFHFAGRRHLGLLGLVPAGLLLGGTVAIRPLAALIVVALVACLAICLASPATIAALATFSAFASLPDSVHVGKVFGPIGFDIQDVLVIFAILALLLKVKLRISDIQPAASFTVVILLGLVIGISTGNELSRNLGEVKNLFIAVSGFLLGALVVHANLLRQTIRAFGAILWFSAAMVLVSSASGLRLAGRNETLEGGAGDTATRILTNTQTPALIAMTALVVLTVIGRIGSKPWLFYGTPAAVILLLGFSRNTLLALAIGAALSLLFTFSWQSVRRITAMTIAGLACASFSAGALYLLQGSASANWANGQLRGYFDRVFEGTSTDALSKDPSTLYRLRENDNLIQAFWEAPLFGHGFGYAYQPPIGASGFFAAIDGPYYAHNFYLWILVKAGVIGFVGFACFALPPAVRAARDGRTFPRAAGIVSISMLIICLVNPLPLGSANSLALGLMLGCAAALGKVRSQSLPPPSPIAVVRERPSGLEERHQYMFATPEGSSGRRQRRELRLADG